VDTTSIPFKIVTDQRAQLAEDVAAIRAFDLLPKTLVVAGAIYDVHTGEISPVDC